jgi:hypothetical protein
VTITRNFAGVTSRPFRDFLADPDRLAVAAGAGDGLWLDNDLHALQMGRERLARTCFALPPLACRPGRRELGLDHAKIGLNLVEGEGLLVAFEFLGAAAEAGALQLLDDHVEIGNPVLGALIDCGHADDLGLELCCLGLVLPRLCLQLILPGRRSNQHCLERVDVVGKGRSRARHDLTRSISGPVPAPVFAA